MEPAKPEVGRSVERPEKRRSPLDYRGSGACAVARVSQRPSLRWPMVGVLTG